MSKKVAGVFEVTKTTTYKITIYEDPTLLEDFNRAIWPGSKLSDVAQYIAQYGEDIFVDGVGRSGEAFDIEGVFDDTSFVEMPKEEPS